jgi:hypothetical protein
MTKLMAEGQKRLGSSYEFHYIDLQGLEDVDDFVAQTLPATRLYFWSMLGSGAPLPFLLLTITPTP